MLILSALCLACSSHSVVITMLIISHFFAVFLANIESSHPNTTEMLERGAFSAARSFIPGKRSAVDKTIKETFVKHA